MTTNQALRAIARCTLLAGAMVVAGGSAYPVSAVSDFLAAFRAQYPSAAGSRIDGCALCHSQIPARNPYGAAYQNAGFAFAPIEGLDSDADGATNLEEIVAL